MNIAELQIIVDDGAQAPARGSAGAAGYDLCAYLPTGKFKVQHVQNEEQVPVEMSSIPPGHRALIPTGVKMAIPGGWYGRVAPRSGLAWKSGIDVMAGVIDNDYRGDIGVVLINLGQLPFTVKNGDRVAQIIFERSATPVITVVYELSITGRGQGGYGSTGSQRFTGVDLTEPVMVTPVVQRVRSLSSVAETETNL